MTQQNATKITLHIKNVFIILIFKYILMLNYVRDFTTLCKFSNFSLCKIMGDEDMRRELEEGRERWLKMEKREREMCVIWMNDGWFWVLTTRVCVSRERYREGERKGGEDNDGIVYLLFDWRCGVGRSPLVSRVSRHEWWGRWRCSWCWCWILSFQPASMWPSLSPPPSLSIFNWCPLLALPNLYSPSILFL